MADERDRTGRRNDEQELRESQRILRHVSQETEAGGPSTIDRATSRTRNHLAASDVDQEDAVDREDWAEYWGTRIGRAIGALFLAAMIIWLVLYLSGAE